MCHTASRHQSLTQSYYLTRNGVIHGSPLPEYHSLCPPYCRLSCRGCSLDAASLTECSKRLDTHSLSNDMSPAPCTYALAEIPVGDSSQPHHSNSPALYLKPVKRLRYTCDLRWPAVRVSWSQPKDSAASLIAAGMQSMHTRKQVAMLPNLWLISTQHNCCAGWYSTLSQ